MYGMVTQPSSRHKKNHPRHQHHLARSSLYRRVFGYVKSAWTGVRFALDPEFEVLGESPSRYRPDSVQALSKATKFSEAEIKRIYRNFKAECPSGVVREETFKGIYSQFFPQGANVSQYAHYVFKTMDHTQTGLLSFEDFVQGLSVLCRGSVEDKLRWTFTLYDINGDGRITREEMTNIVTAIYELMGKFAETVLEDDSVANRVDCVFKKMDKNQDGVVTLDEFLECCLNDEDIKTSIQVFDT